MKSMAERQQKEHEYTKYNYGEEISIVLQKLTRKNIDCVRDFECGNEVIDEYINNPEKSLSVNNGVTYIFVDTKDNVAIGYAVLACSGITHSYQDTRVTLPAIEIKYFALIERLQRLLYSAEDEHYYLSDFLLGMLMSRCVEISEEVAARFIVLYAAKRALKLYNRMGFVSFSEFMEPDKYRFIDGCVPMFIEMT